MLGGFIRDGAPDGALGFELFGADHHQIFGRRNIGQEPTQGKRMITAGAGEAGKDDEKIEPNRKKQFRLALPGRFAIILTRLYSECLELWPRRI